MERASVEDQVLAFEKQFTTAAERFEVCCISIIDVPQFACSRNLWQVLSGITLARGQDVLIRGQGKLIHMVQKVRPFNHSICVTTI